VRSEGYLEASGDNTAFRYAEDGLRVAQVRLRAE
jgi:hypothetical protein